MLKESGNLFVINQLSPVRCCKSFIHGVAEPFFVLEWGREHLLFHFGCVVALLSFQRLKLSLLLGCQRYFHVFTVAWSPGTHNLTYAPPRIARQGSIRYEV